MIRAYSADLGAGYVYFCDLSGELLAEQRLLSDILNANCTTHKMEKVD